MRKRCLDFQTIIILKLDFHDFYVVFALFTCLLNTQIKNGFQHVVAYLGINFFSFNPDPEPLTVFLWPYGLVNDFTTH